MPRYRFRVKAVNKLGQSLPCDMKGGAIVIKVRMRATLHETYEMREPRGR